MEGLEASAFIEDGSQNLFWSQDHQDAETADWLRVYGYQSVGLITSLAIETVIIERCFSDDMSSASSNNFVCHKSTRDCAPTLEISEENPRCGFPAG